MSLHAVVRLQVTDNETGPWVENEVLGVWNSSRKRRKERTNGRRRRKERRLIQEKARLEKVLNSKGGWTLEDERKESGIESRNKRWSTRVTKTLRMTVKVGVSFPSWINFTRLKWRAASNLQRVRLNGVISLSQRNRHGVRTLNEACIIPMVDPNYERLIRLYPRSNLHWFTFCDLNATDPAVQRPCGFIQRSVKEVTISGLDRK